MHRNLLLHPEAEVGKSATEVTATLEETKPEVVGEVKDTPKEKVFTQAEVDALVSKRLAREREKAKEEQEKAESLAKLSEEERSKVLAEEQKAKLADKEAQLNLREMKLQAIDIMNERSLPISMVDFVVGKDPESTLANIGTFEKSFNEAVEAKVTLKIKGSTYTPGDGADEVLSGVENAFYNINPALKPK